MSGRNYYVTTLGEWRRNAHRFSVSHFVRAGFLDVRGAGTEGAEAVTAASAVLVLAEGDEGLHNELLRDQAWESLPHPLGNRAVSDQAAKALAGLGVQKGATTFEVAEAAAKTHPMMRYQVL